LWGSRLESIEKTGGVDGASGSGLGDLDRGTRRSTSAPGLRSELMVSPSRVERAMVLLYPGCTVAETIELATRLREAGANMTHLAPTIDPFRDRSGLSMHPDATIDEIDPITVDVLVVPGGDPEAIIDDESVLEFVAAAAGNGAMVAGICAGVLVMAASGVTAGRSITHNYRRPWAPPEIAEFVDRFWAGATVEPDPAIGVVVDGPIITALPNATIEFATTVCRELDLYSPEEADQIARHLRGSLVTELTDQV